MFALLRRSSALLEPFLAGHGDINGIGDLHLGSADQAKMIGKGSCQEVVLSLLRRT